MCFFDSWSTLPIFAHLLVSILSDLFQEVCHLHEITKTCTTAYHPSSNGLVERCNGTLGSMIRSYLEDGDRENPLNMHKNCNDSCQGVTKWPESTWSEPLSNRARHITHAYHSTATHQVEQSWRDRTNTQSSKFHGWALTWFDVPWATVCHRWQIQNFCHPPRLSKTSARAHTPKIEVFSSYDLIFFLIFFSNSITILTVFSYLYHPMSSSYILM